MSVHDLAAMLQDANLVSADDVARLEKHQRAHGGSVALNVVKLEILSEETLTEFLSQVYRVPPLTIDENDVDGDAVKLVPQELATKFQVLPVKRDGRLLTVAMIDPDNIFAIDDIKFLTGFEVQPVVAAESKIKRLIDRHYDQADTMARVMEDLDSFDDLEVLADSDEELDIAEIGDESAPVVKLVNSLLADAVLKGASDLHIEPYEKKLRVRYRIDGVLYEMMNPPLRMKMAIISRLKIMADLDIAERRIPQDGRIKIKIAGKMIDLRVSTLPTIFGEKVVLRILDKSNLRIDLGEFGMEQGAFEHLVRAIESPYGMVLVTGPTGSGKTTTLYSCLARLNRPGTNITTAEDPVEYNLDGINQVQIHEEIGLSFANALRAFLRQDPNIILVGEIRDYETGSIAVKAALTGHLVLSTLHTNDAPSTIGRLVDMGIEPFLVASSVHCIVAQRLVRRVCENCKQETTLHEEMARELGIPDQAGAPVLEPRGCDACSDTGYRGRQGLYEVLPISPAVRRMVLERVPSSVIKQQAMEEGMLTLRMDGTEKVLRGITSVEEVLKETAGDQRDD
jgi:type IV pilus assembly protein PilB